MPMLLRIVFGIAVLLQAHYLLSGDRSVVAKVAESRGWGSVSGEDTEVVSGLYAAGSDGPLFYACGSARPPAWVSGPGARSLPDRGIRYVTIETNIDTTFRDPHGLAWNTPATSQRTVLKVIESRPWDDDCHAAAGNLRAAGRIRGKP